MVGIIDEDTIRKIGHDEAARRSAREIEAAGVIPHPEPAHPQTPAEAGRRPSARFGWSLGRGQVGAVWILGRTVRISVRDRDVPDTTFGEYLENGPPDALSALPAAWASEIDASVRTLAALPCACGTGFDRPDSHGDLTIFACIQHPDAYGTDTFTAARCRVCGLRWLIRETGDMCYASNYTAIPLEAW